MLIVGIHHLIEKLKEQSVVLDVLVNNGAISPEKITPLAKPEPIKDMTLK